MTVAALPDRRQRCIRINVAGSGAVPQLADSIARIAVFLVLAWFILVGVASRTVGGIGCEPIGHRLAVACMAIIARQIARVCAGIGWRRVDKVERRRPSLGAMAVHAIRCGAEMAWSLACRAGAVVA